MNKVGANCNNCCAGAEGLIEVNSSQFVKTFSKDTSFDAGSNVYPTIIKVGVHTQQDYDVRES